MTLRFRLVAPALAAALAFAAPSFAETARFTVLFTTDLHGNANAYDYLNDRPAPRGLVRIASIVKDVRAEGHPVLLLDSGDCIQGAPLETVHRNRSEGRIDPMMAAMNVMKYDAMALGNHEFNFGLEVIEKARSAATFPWLSANIRKVDDGSPYFRPSLVKMVGPVKVGIVGLTTPQVPTWEDPPHYAGLRFDSPVAAAQAEVKRLREQERCDVVVAIAHTGFERDPDTGAERPSGTPDENWGYRIASQVEGLDLLMMGHTHVVVHQAMVGGTMVSQSGKWAEHLGRADFELERANAASPWRLSKRASRAIAVTDTTALDPEVAAVLAPYHDNTQRYLGETLGTCEHEIGSPLGRHADGPMWELIHRVQLEATGADLSLAAMFDPAARIKPGPVTVRDVHRLYVYDNTLGVIRLTGAEVKETLEHAARYFQPYDFTANKPMAMPGMPGYNFDALEGVDYELDLTRPPGDRVVNLTWRGQAVDPAQTFTVAANNYRLNGGGGYAAVKSAPRVGTARPFVRDAIAEYIRKAGTIRPAWRANWTLLPDYVATDHRGAIDRLVREGVAPAAEVLRLHPDQAALRGDAAYWLARSWGWREKRLSGAFGDVPDSLEPWLDGLLRRGVLGTQASSEWLRPFAKVTQQTMLDWASASAKEAGLYLPDGPSDASFRRALLHAAGFGAQAASDTLTRAQLLAMVSAARYPTLRLLETTDFHGAITSSARERRSNRPIGGSAVLAAHVAKLRAENPEGTVLLDGGDCFQGTMISNLQHGRPVVEQMNHLGYTAMAVGNHEFDWSADTLIDRVREMNFAALSANMKEKRSGRTPRWARPDTLVSRRGLKVGVIGLSYVNTPAVTLPTHVAHLRFEDDSASAARRVPELRKKGKADVVVVVGHVPGRTDSTRALLGDDLARLARGVQGVDAWFGGHSHNQIADDVDGVPVMIAGAQGQVVAVADLVVDPVRDRVIERSYRLQPTYVDEVRPDSTMAAKVAVWNAAVGPIAARVVGRSTARLSRNRESENPVGNLVADAMRAEVKADVALQNPGGLRADLPQGDLTVGHIYEVMPFDNSIVVLELTGAELKLALHQALDRGTLLQVSGIRMTTDRGAPRGERLTALTLTDGTVIDDAKRYKVAVNNFMADGGDDLIVLQAAKLRTATGILVRDALEKYVAARSAQGPIGAELEGRILVVGNRQ